MIMSLNTHVYATWNSRAAKHDHTNVECSHCGHQEPNYKAVILGHNSDTYTGIRLPYCPNCGYHMQIPNERSTSIMPNSDSIEDIQCDLTDWEQELARLQAEEEPDTEAISECKSRIRTLQQALLDLA